VLKKNFILKKYLTNSLYRDIIYIELRKEVKRLKTRKGSESIKMKKLIDGAKSLVKLLKILNKAIIEIISFVGWLLILIKLFD